MPAAQPMRALDRLKKAANLVPIKKRVTLSDGEDFEFYCTPLTMAERERAQKDANSEDATAFALQLLVQKAKDENNQPLFRAGQVSELKNDVRDEDLQTLMLAVITSENDVTEEEAKN
jgi:hypothetical protein